MGSEALSSGDRPVRDLVHEVVADLSPGELPMLEGLFDLDDSTAVRRLSGQGQRREPLGFGMGEIAVLITPVVWLTLDQAARRFADTAVDVTSRQSTALLRRLFRRGRAPVTVPALTREQLAEVRRLVLESAAQRGLPAQRASEVADSVVARLVLAEPSDSGSGPASGPDSDSGPGSASTSASTSTSAEARPDTPAVTGTAQED
ncbi:hypothetical protein ACIBJC_37560 [Streptomyces sp. NPDC050509]|uniref:hypothetical protein n=1 Tax=Streptomyces sp. NPDC050509 TaxID=3365620 RepID=UPI00379D07E3